MLGFRRWSHVRRRDQKASFCVSGPLSGPLSQILRESVRSRRSSDLNFSEQVFEFLKTDIPNGVGQR